MQGFFLDNKIKCYPHKYDLTTTTQHVEILCLDSDA